MRDIAEHTAMPTFCSLVPEVKTWQPTGQRAGKASCAPGQVVLMIKTRCIGHGAWRYEPDLIVRNAPRVLRCVHPSTLPERHIKLTMAAQRRLADLIVDPQLGQRDHVGPRCRGARRSRLYNGENYERLAAVASARVRGRTWHPAERPGWAPLLQCLKVPKF